MFTIILKWISFLDVASELHEKWQGNRRSSISKEDVNAARWKQLKTTLQSGKHKVLFNLLQSKLFCVQSPAVLFTLFGPLSVYQSSFDFTRLYNIPISQLQSHLLIHALMFNNCANCYIFKLRAFGDVWKRSSSHTHILDLTWR